ncbi:hypothetical protein Pcinc_020883 [Petrolisthes cinctipes]|uniref:Protein kintoun n=1 Tax=Petrolisthes cinctipes TaxID=88211 RepID=A0AAE1FH89_PETCI|nr:hypothetical protein Pcinc_020883 [Petrolisthes cinctipes]
MASKDTSSLHNHHFSREDLALLAKNLKDEKFRALLKDYAEEISDPVKRKQYENELKQLGKECGVEAAFVHPSPGFALYLDPQQGSDEHIYVNICSSEVVERPSYVEVRDEGGKLGQNWSLPHALPKPRHELLDEAGGEANNKEIGLFKQGLSHEEGVKKVLSVDGKGVTKGEVTCGRSENPGVLQNSPTLQKALVHDVVFHPYALQLATQRPVMKRTLINSAMDSLSKTFSVKGKAWQELEECLYVGVPVQSVIKRVIDKKLFEKSEGMGFKPLDERTFGEQIKSKDQVNCDVNKNKASEVKPDEAITPVYMIKHVSKLDLQDYSIQLIPQYKQQWRPQALEVQIELPGVTRASQVDANVWQQTIYLLTESEPKYKLELPLPYPVNEETTAAKLDVVTHKLTLTLSVIPADKKHHMSLDDHSPSSDSGIELESDNRTNSDVDNSSETSVSSQEEAAQKDVTAAGDDDNVFETETESSPQAKIFLVPSYSVKDSKKNLLITLNCGNVLARSIETKQEGDSTASIKLSSIGGGQTLLHYRLKIDCSPHHIAKAGMSYKLEEKQVIMAVRKATPGQWKDCLLGQESNMLKVTLVPGEALASEEENKSSTDVSPSKGDEELKKEDSKNILSVVRPHRIARTVSMCETISTHPNNLRLRGPTCSWPRGILKHRSRSLSESQLGDDFSAMSLGSAYSSIDMDSKLDGEDEGEESIEEGISSSFGEKKSVRFNEVVSRQLFRSNKSILGRRIKNQKKAMKKRKNRQGQGKTESSQTSNTATVSDGFTTTTDDDTDATTTDATEPEDVEVSPNIDDVEHNLTNKNSSNMSVMNQCYHESIRVTSSTAKDIIEKCDNKNEEDSDDTGFIVKTSRRKKRNKNKATFEPSNNLIFQLDLDK